MVNKPYQVGITGGIGAGKSLISKIFSILEIPVFNADQSAKNVMHEHENVVGNVKELFGVDAYKEGKLNRKRIASVVFKDKSLLSRLNAVVHPAVAQDYSNWLVNNSDSKFIIKEAALLFENQSSQQLDKIILVSAPEDLRIDRVLSRDKHRRGSDIKAIMNNQLSEDKMRSMADYIIQNDEKAPVITQVMKLYEELLAQSIR